MNTRLVAGALNIWPLNCEKEGQDIVNPASVLTDNCPVAAYPPDPTAALFSNCTCVDECDEDKDDCHVHSTCVDNDGSFTCTCDLG